MTFQQIYRAMFASQGFPRSPEDAQWRKNRAGEIYGRVQRAESGEARQSHVSDSQVMLRCMQNTRNDFLPQLAVEMEIERIESAA